MTRIAPEDYELATIAEGALPDLSSHLPPMVLLASR